MKCYNARCGRTAQKGRKKCFQCLVSNAKYMRYYRERKEMDRMLRVIASATHYIRSRAAEQLAIRVDQEILSDPRFTAEFLETPEGIALDSAICDKLVQQWDKERPAGEPNILDGIPVSAPPAGKSLGVSGSNAAQP